MVVRLKQLKIENIRNVENGTITFAKGQNIIGVFGPNGSGKSVVIEALSILWNVMIGRSIRSAVTNDVITIGTKTSEITALFELIEEERIASLKYSFRFGKNPDGMVLLDEVLCMSVQEEADTIMRMQPVVDTTDKYEVFGPETRKKQLIHKYEGKKERLWEEKMHAREEGKSFIFNPVFLSSIDTYEFIGRCIEELWLFAQSSMSIQKHISTDPVEQHFTREVTEKVNQVIPVLLPGRSIQYIPGEKEPLYMCHDGLLVPFRMESEGVRKLIALTAALIPAFNQQSYLLAIDNMDEKIYELLLGQILEVFGQKGKGQLIFTGYDLRSMEVLDYKAIRVTTENPCSRYERPKHIGATNNLRSLYLREALLGEDGKAVRITSVSEITDHFLKAGDI